MRRKQAVLTFAFLLLITRMVSADNPKSFGNFFGGVVTTEDNCRMLNVGAGGEKFLTGYFSIGGEAGYVGFLQNPFAAANVLLSGNAYFHFRKETALKQFLPFLTAGFSRAGISPGVNLIHVGGGVDIWNSPRRGARIEIRDQIDRQGSANVHYWGIRAALIFR